MADFLGIGPGVAIGEGWDIVPPLPGPVLREKIELPSVLALQIETVSAMTRTIELAPSVIELEEY